MNILPETGQDVGALALASGGLVPVARETLQLDRHAPSVYVAGLAKGSRRAMSGALELAARLLSGGAMDVLSLPWPLLRYEHLAALRSVLAELYAPAYANKVLSAVRGTLKSAWRLGQMSSEDYGRAVDVPNVKGTRLVAGRMLSNGELLALFQACATSNGVAGARDAALLALMAGAGLRRGEVVALLVADYNAQSGEIRIRAGKGNKERLAFVGKSGREALDYWLLRRGSEPGPLFCALRRGRPRNLRAGESDNAAQAARELDAARIDTPLNDQSVMDILLKRIDEAGLNDASPHDLRRTFISNILDAGADIATVQKLVGHSSPATTARYDRRDDETKKRAAELVPLPYVAPASAAKRRQKRGR